MGAALDARAESAARRVTAALVATSPAIVGVYIHGSAVLGDFLPGRSDLDVLTVVRDGVTIIGPLNLASQLPLHASQMYGRNVYTLLQHLTASGALQVDVADEITGPMAVTHGGAVRFGAS